MPFKRPSGDHGTAYEIAGKNGVDAGSMEEAARFAAKISSIWKVNKPKKYFSQNFLKDILVKIKICHYLNPTKNDVFVEIGPGKGELTKTLLKKTNQVNAVEIDKDLIIELKGLQKKHKNLWFGLIK